MAVGLSYWKMMRLIILPQALKITIPNIVNTTIGLFKDTTLVFIVGIFDFLMTIEAARGDPNWITPVTGPSGYAFAAIFYVLDLAAWNAGIRLTKLGNSTLFGNTGSFVFAIYGLWLVHRMPSLKRLFALFAWRPISLIFGSTRASILGWGPRMSCHLCRCVA